MASILCQVRAIEILTLVPASVKEVKETLGRLRFDNSPGAPIKLGLGTVKIRAFHHVTISRSVWASMAIKISSVLYAIEGNFLMSVMHTVEQ